MARIACPKRICDISEQAFWSSMKPPAKGAAVEVLSEAIRLGKAGRKARAYARLADYHRVALAGEWAFHRDRAVRAWEDNAEKISRDCDDLLRHRIKAWHTTVIDFGEKIDWDCGKTDKYGFHYMGWFSPGVTRLIAQREEAVRSELMRIVDSYYAARNRLSHPIPGLHLVYYELGARAKTNVLLPFYLALLNTGDIPTRTHEALMKLFVGFARSLESLQKSYRGGNWQLVGCSTLHALANVFPEFREHKAWERVAVRYLLEHVEKDFYADGGHHERCWGYGYMSLGGLTDAYQLAQRHGGFGRHDARVLRCIRDAFRWFAKTLGPNDLKPAFGDCQLSSGSGILDAARPFFPPATDRYLGIDRTKSYLLKSSEFAVMRNGDTPDAAHLLLSYGNIAWWHSHMDTLSLNFWAKGKPLIEEVGRFGGYGEALTILFRAPESHNVLTVDGMHYDNVDARNRAGRDPFWHSTPEADFFTAWHTAYRAHRLEPQALDIAIRRTVVFVKDPGYALVFDSAWSEFSPDEGPAFSVTQHWHAPFPFDVVAPGVARTRGDEACMLVFARPDALRRLEPGIDFAGSEATNAGIYPERYHLRARQWMDVEYRGACGIATLLYPFRGEQPRVAVTPLPLEGAPSNRAEAFEIQTPRGRDVIVLNPERLRGLTLQGRPVTGRGLIRLGNGRGTLVIR